AKHEAAVAARWRGWVDDAFKNGAGCAHRATTLQERLEVLSQPGQADPYALAGTAMDQWEELWFARGADWLPLPGDASSWTQLPPLDVPQLRETTQSFSWKTAVGHGCMHPTAMLFASDAAFATLALLFVRCETMLCSGRGGVGSDSITLHLASQRDPYLYPIFDVTLLPAMKYCEFIWDERLPLAGPQRAWQ
ncbi:unnamed protein product, partial [Prorocentrum cordatum]